MKRRQSWSIAVFIVASLGLLRGCAKDEEFTETPPPPDDLGAICSFNSDCVSYCAQGVANSAFHCTRNCDDDDPCPTGYVCISRDGQQGKVCGLGSCTGNDDCPESYVCDGETNVCHHNDIPCGIDADCPAATACNQGLCETLCTSDDGCKQGWMCHHEARCVLCMGNSDCEDGYACAFGQCNTACISEHDCRQGFECVDAACQEIEGGGAGVVGDECTENSQCTAFCQSSYCSQTCDLSDPQSCPEGYSCSEHHLTCYAD